MRIQRVFLSGPMDKAVKSSPNGVTGASVNPRSVFGLASSAAFPVVQTNQVLLIQNDGIDTLILGYDDTIPAGLDGSRLQVPAGHHAYITDSAGGISAMYRGGPFTIILGSFYYCQISDSMNPNYPGIGVSA